MGPKRKIVLAKSNHFFTSYHCRFSKGGLFRLHCRHCGHYRQQLTPLPLLKLYTQMVFIWPHPAVAGSTLGAQFAWLALSGLCLIARARIVNPTKLKLKFMLFCTVAGWQVFLHDFCGFLDFDNWYSHCFEGRYFNVALFDQCMSAIWLTAGCVYVQQRGQWQLEATPKGGCPQGSGIMPQSICGIVHSTWHRVSVGLCGMCRIV